MWDEDSFLPGWSPIPSSTPADAKEHISDRGQPLASHTGHPYNSILVFILEANKNILIRV